VLQKWVQSDDVARRGDDRLEELGERRSKRFEVPGLGFEANDLRPAK
jgi:hypothetical protein